MGLNNIWSILECLKFLEWFLIYNRHQNISLNYVLCWFIKTVFSCILTTITINYIIQTPTSGSLITIQINWQLPHHFYNTIMQLKHRMILFLSRFKLHIIFWSQGKCQGQGHVVVKHLSLQVVAKVKVTWQSMSMLSQSTCTWSKEYVHQIIMNCTLYGLTVTGKVKVDRQTCKS